MMKRNAYSKDKLALVILIMVGVMVGLSACRSELPSISSARTRPQPDVLTEEERVEAAETTLIKYFAELHDGNYEQAVKHFEGSFLVLQALNPNDPTEDHVTLLEDACEINDFLCLNVLEIVSTKKVDEHTYQVEVIFENEDGSAVTAEFIQSVDANPFVFTVIEHEGEFFVQDLPLALRN